MRLTIPERLILMDFLRPDKEDYASWKEINRALMSLSFTSDEIIDLEVIQTPDTVKWSSEKGKEYIADIPLSEWITTRVQEKLRENNKKHELEAKHLTLYEKFIVAYDQI